MTRSMFQIMVSTLFCIHRYEITTATSSGLLRILEDDDLQIRGPGDPHLRRPQPPSASSPRDDLLSYDGLLLHPLSPCLKFPFKP